MVKEKFDFTFTHEGEKVNASCMVMKGNIHVKVPMYRVLIQNGKKEDVYIFYETNKDGKRFFTHNTEGTKGSIAAKIEKALNKH